MDETKAVAGGFHRRKLQSRTALAATIAVAVAALVWSMVATSRVHVVYNLSDSAPIGWYRIQPAHELAVDTVVLAWLPLTFRQLAAERDYLPSHLPIVKPPRVCSACFDGSGRPSIQIVIGARSSQAPIV